MAHTSFGTTTTLPNSRLQTLLRWLFYALVAAIAVLILWTAGTRILFLLRAENLAGIAGGDAAIFAEMTRTFAGGGQLYVDTWDIKPPVLFFALTPFVWVFGNTVFAMYAGFLSIAAAFVVVVAVLVYQFTHSKEATGVAALLALLYGASQTEPHTTLLMAALGAVSVALAVGGRGRLAWMLAAGTCFGLGIFAKQVLILEAPIPLLFAYWAARNQKLRAAILVGVGMCLGVGAIGLWAYTHGVWDEFWYRSLVINFQYVGAGDGGWHFREDTLALFRGFFVDATLPYLLPLIVFSAGIHILTLRSRPKPGLWLVIAWVILAFAGAFVGRGFRIPYFYQVLPSLILLGAIAVPSLLQRPVALRILFAFLLLPLIWNFSARFVNIPEHELTSDRRDEDQVVSLVQQQITGDECLWTWGHVVVINYLSARTSCVGAAHAGFMMDDTAFPVTRTRIEYMQELLAQRPRLHVRDEIWGYFPELQKYADRYLREPLFSNELYQVFRVDVSTLHTTHANFAGEIALVGYDLPLKASYCPGEALPMAMTWQRIQTPAQQYQMFVHLLTADSTGRVAGYDGVPADRPTNTWVDDGEIVLGESFELIIPEDAHPGRYALVAGLYDVESLEHAPVLGPDGQSHGTYAVLQDILIESDGCAAEP